MSGIRKLIGEAHRRSLWQVLGIYLAVSWIVLQVIDVLTNNFGLPDWVPPFALVLLLLGLPIVLATAFVQEGIGSQKRAAPELPTDSDPDSAPSPAAASPAFDTAAEPRAAGARHRLFTWRRAMTGGVLAFALLGVVTLGWVAMRTFGVGPAATLVAAGVLDERDRVIVADFGSASGDSILAQAATEALRVDLTQSQIVTVVEPRFVAAALTRMERPKDTPLDREVATELAVREGIKAIITGEINAAGGGYVLTAEVIAASSDETLASQRVTANEEEDLLAALDKLSAKLRERIGESLKSTRADPPLEQATTHSLESLRLFSQATRAIDIDSENDRGIALLEEAVKIDTTFALAWRKLGTQQMNEASPRSVWGPPLARAFELRDRLSERERYLAAASYYGYLTREPEKSLPAYESMLKLDPDDVYALNNGALELIELGEYARAEEMVLRAIEIQPQLRFLYMTAMAAQTLQIRPDAANATLVALDQALPGIPATDVWGGWLAYSQGDYELAELRLEGDLERRRSSPGPRASRSRELAIVARTTGRLAEAERREADAVAANAERGSSTANLDAALDMAHADMALRGDAGRALGRTEEALSAVPLNAIDVIDRPYLRLANVYAMAGRSSQARETLDEYERLIPPELFDEKAHRNSEGLIALTEGRVQEAINHLLQAVDGRCTRRCASLGRAYDSTGQPDSAIAVMERFVTTPLWSFGILDLGMQEEANNRGPFYERLGQLYDEKGDLENAAKYYAMFVELWSEADEELQPRVRAAQSRLEEIVREQG
jgi:tetratricopeptide (TPR) repeat protein